MSQAVVLGHFVNNSQILSASCNFANVSGIFGAYIEFITEFDN